MELKKFIKQNILVTAASLLSVAVSFISQIVIAYYFGTSSERDAYFSAAVIPTYITTLFVGSVTVVVLPYYVHFKVNKSDPEIIKLVSNMIGLCGLLLIILALFAYCTSSHVVKWLAPGFNEEQLTATQRLFDVLIFSVIFQGLSGFITIFYHVEKSFLKPAMAPVVVSLVSLVFVYFYSEHGIISLAAGTLTGAVISNILLLPALGGKVKFNELFSFFNEEISSLLKLIAPLFFSGVIYKAAPVAERVIASTLPTGSISYLGYGGQIYLLLATILSGSIATTFFPLMAEAWAKENKEELAKYLLTGIRLTFFITLPIAAIIIVLAYPIVKSLFEYGAFDTHSSRAVGNVLAILMGALIFSALGNLIVKIFYITKMTKLISVISIVEILIYVVLGYYLSSFLSYLGLAVALSVSSGFTIVCSFVALKKLNFNFRGALRDILKLVLASAFCGLAAQLIFYTLGAVALGVVVTTSVSTLLSLIIYLFLVGYVFKIAEFSNFISIAQKYFNSNKPL